MQPPTLCSRFLSFIAALLSASCSPAEKPGTQHASSPPAPLPSSPPAAVIQGKRQSYREALAELTRENRKLHGIYASAPNHRERARVLDTARDTVTQALLNEIFPAWYGTKWDFNGITEVPGEGAIACGYFVTTTVRDAGFKLPRMKLAQQPSQTIIRTLCEPSTIRVYYEKPLETVRQYLREHGPGIYIVGLDCHTGFVVNEGRQVTFVHASYFQPPRAVIAEPLDSDNPLHRSKYRMIGKLFGDELLQRWLEQREVPMKKDS